MALPGSGTISLGDIAGEFGGTVPHALTEYYGAAPGVPASGTISTSDFYGTSAISLTRTAVNQIVGGSSGGASSSYIAPIGTASADRIVVVMVQHAGGFGQTRITGVTFNGTPASFVTSPFNLWQMNAIAWLNVPTGTTMDVRISLANTFNGTTRYTIFDTRGLNGNAAGTGSLTTGSTPFVSQTFTPPANQQGFWFASFSTENAGAGNTYTWSLPGGGPLVSQFNITNQGGFNFGMSQHAYEYPAQAASSKAATLVTTDTSLIYENLSALVLT